MNNLNELCKAERDYLYEMGKIVINVPEAIRMNNLYFDKLQEYRDTLDDEEEKYEIDYELAFLLIQEDRLNEIINRLSRKFRSPFSVESLDLITLRISIEFIRHRLNDIGGLNNENRC